MSTTIVRKAQAVWSVLLILTRRVTARLLVPMRTRPREAGMTTAEYAVGTIAACAFAAILYQVVTGESVVAALGALISRALSTI